MPFKKIGSKTVGKAINTNRNRDTSLDTSVDENRTQNAAYKYTNDTQATLVVEPWVRSITFSGVAMGGNGGASGNGSPFNDGNGGTGGGGGAGNFIGYTTSTTNILGQTLYIGIGDPSSPRNTYVKTGSHSGTSIFELNKGNNAGAGGAASGLYGDSAGGNGAGSGPGGPVPGPGGSTDTPYPGNPTTNSGAGGGAGGNVYGNWIGKGGFVDSPPNVSSPKTNPSNYWLAVNNTTYSVGIGSIAGGNFGSNKGGAGAGFELDGTAYGGGGGGGGTNAGQPPKGGNDGIGGALVIQFSSNSI